MRLVVTHLPYFRLSERERESQRGRENQIERERETSTGFGVQFCWSPRRSFSVVEGVFFGVCCIVVCFVCLPPVLSSPSSLCVDVLMSTNTQANPKEIRVVVLVFCVQLFHLQRGRCFI